MIGLSKKRKEKKTVVDCADKWNKYFFNQYNFSQEIQGYKVLRQDVHFIGNENSEDFCVLEKK